MKKQQVGFVCFGEINTPFERLQIKHDQALKTLAALDCELLDAGIVIDDPGYETADAALAKLEGAPLSCLIVCVAGWVPTHAVIRVTDPLRHVPMLLWGLCGWYENGRFDHHPPIRPAPLPSAPRLRRLAIRSSLFTALWKSPRRWTRFPPSSPLAAPARPCAAPASARWAIAICSFMARSSRAIPCAARSAIEVEPFEMLEMVQNLEKLDAEKVREGIRFVKENWVFKRPCDDSVIEKGVRYALAVGLKI